MMGLIWKKRSLYPALLVVMMLQGCMRPRANLPVIENTQPALIKTQAVTATLPPETETPAPTVTIAISPTETPLPKVTISAQKGNLYIRRGPGMAYDRVGVLFSGTSAEVIARDVLSKWVQVNIPDSEQTGWVSLQTDYSRLDGDLSTVPDFTFTDWPVPAYLFNCTEHDMYIMPGEIIVTSYFTHPNNQVWLNPGRYSVYDDSIPKRPLVKEIDIREGANVAIVYDGAGNHHKCP
jgi:uncharacterized protein YraI